MDEEALIARANEEREKIFQRYERGREAGAEIDPWEEFNVYTRMDRYGIIHGKPLPSKPDHKESKTLIEMKRVDKWLKMLNKWGSKGTSEKLRKRVFKGIPEKLRTEVWMKLLNIKNIMADKKNKATYQKMLKLARQWSTEARQIDSDVNRQFREHTFYRERYSIKQRSLFNVLVAYSMYNMEVGYCQGMSGLAGVLLMYLNEEEAFWALSVLLADKKYAMHGLYIEGFPKLTRFLAHHDHIVTKFAPKLKKHFDLYNLDSILYSLKWFFVIFVERIPFNLCLRVWDIYLLEGERVVTAMAYTILRLHKNKILKFKDMDLIVQYLQVKLHTDFGYDDDTVIKTLEQTMDDLKKAKMDLPPPPQPNEFPKNPFGEFKEPTTEAKIGIRKSVFTETEKEVTDKVILRRQITENEIAEGRLSDGAIGGSNSQLNAGHVPESEDGCSLLGSSRKSLADTSVTSTADLSVFSGGQRSQQAFDICIDDSRSVHSNEDDDEEISPGSGFCSLSIVGRTSSALMVTPTYRAMSPQDIVRIYVPAASPEEIENASKNNSQSDSQTNLSKLIMNGSRQNMMGSFSEKINIKTDTDSISINNYPMHNFETTKSLNINEEELHSLDDFAGTNGSYPSSSFRRGSLSRKSPSPKNSDIFYQCEHIMHPYKETDITKDIEMTNNTIKVNVAGNDDIMNRSVIQNSPSKYNDKIMTSFEKLAIKKNTEQQNTMKYSETRMTKSEIYKNSSRLGKENDNHDYHTYFPDKTSTLKSDSDCNIQYKELSHSFEQSDIEYRALKQKQNSIDNEIDVERENSDKYGRYFGDYEEDDHKFINKSSDESSSSLASKSLLNTPINETIPLLPQTKICRNNSDETSSLKTPVTSPILQNYTHSDFKNDKIYYNETNCITIDDDTKNFPTCSSVHKHDENNDSNHSPISSVYDFNSSTNNVIKTINKKKTSLDSTSNKICIKINHTNLNN